MGFDPRQPPRHEPGSGLGLPGMRERVGLVNGALSIESAPGQGTCITVSLPLAGKGRVEHMAQTRILLVDDHAVVRGGLRMLLAADPELEIVGEAETGAAGVRLAGELQPDVVLMDISMPDMNGIEATRQHQGRATRRSPCWR